MVELGTPFREGEEAAEDVMAAEPAGIAGGDARTDTESHLDMDLEDRERVPERVPKRNINARGRAKRTSNADGDTEINLTDWERPGAHTTPESDDRLSATLNPDGQLLGMSLTPNHATTSSPTSEDDQSAAEEEETTSPGEKATEAAPRLSDPETHTAERAVGRAPPRGTGLSDWQRLRLGLSLPPRRRY